MNSGHIYLRAARAASDVARIKRRQGAREWTLRHWSASCADNGKSLYAIAGELTRLDIARPRGRHEMVFGVRSQDFRIVEAKALTEILFSLPRYRGSALPDASPRR